MCSVGYWRFHSNPSLSAKHKKKSRQVYLNAIFCLCFATPRRRRGGMCERSEQIPESEGLIQRQLWPFNLQGPRGKRPGMCDHREQIPPSEVSKYCESTARNFKELQYALIINSWIIWYNWRNWLVHHSAPFSRQLSSFAVPNVSCLPFFSKRRHGAQMQLSMVQ